MELTEIRGERLLKKLAQCQQVDSECQQFGSQKHRYQINPPLSPAEVRAIEKQYGFALPEDYFWFLTVVGNGGAGPNYGLYPFGTEGQEEDFPRLAQPRVLDPKASPEEYEDFIAYYEEDCDDEEFERREEKLWQGLLTIGTAGCTYDMMLVVTGAERGRILHIDRDRQRPYFSPDASFLDWYERWLTETAEGCQMHNFNSRIGGNAEELCGRYPDADESEKYAIIRALYKYNTVASVLVEQFYIYFMSEEDPARKGVWLAHLNRFGYAQIDRLLRAGLTDPMLCEYALYTLQTRFNVRRKVDGRIADVWLPEVDDWYTGILSALPLAVSLSPDAEGAFYSCMNLLTGCSCFRMEDMEPFFYTANDKQRSRLFYICKEKSMSHWFAERYYEWLLENCEKRNYHEIRSALGECLSVAKRNTAETAWLSTKLTEQCLKLLRGFSSAPPDIKDPYIRNNVYQTLESLGKSRSWVDRHR